MFKNNVFSASTDTKMWFKSAAIRATKTMAQMAISVIGTSTLMGNVNWIMVVSSSVLGGILSLLTSVAGLPEVNASDGGTK